jgi:SAM-dependent methyltransferase
VEFVRWDAARLPLRAGCVDVAVVDLPFGVSCGNAGLNRRLYPLALAELARVLRPGGRLVLMTLGRKLLQAALAAQAAAAHWAAMEAHEVNVGGLCCAVLVLVRTAAPPPADASERGGGFVAAEGQTLKGGAKWKESTTSQQQPAAAAVAAAAVAAPVQRERDLLRQ